MPEFALWQHFMQSLLARTRRADGSRAFLDEALPQAIEALEADAAAVVAPSPPEWQVIASCGVPANQVPTEIAAEALDRESTVRDAPWIATPLSRESVLLIKGEVAEERLAKVAAALAEAIETAETLDLRTRRIRRLEKILEITHAWSQTQCMKSLLQAMAETATELFDADRASIFLWDKAGKILIGRPALGLEGDELRIPDDTGIVGQVVHSVEPRRVDRRIETGQIAQEIDQETGYRTESLICVPLISPGGKCFGAFEVLNKRNGRFDHDDQQGLIELASHAAVALENTKHLEGLLSEHQRLVQEAAGEIELIGNSTAIEAVRSTIGRIADTDLAILILGENGTGKEVIARSIHYLSGRREQPFIAVNCAALTETLLESELFGHEKGAFTDASETRVGKFELASGGTLFLDEIGDMSLSGQAKMLRVLEDKTVVRVGGSTPIYTGVRILAATNQELGKMVREKRFREDLFFRLNVVSVVLPPLRDRGDDILLLAKFFLESFCRNMGRATPKFSAGAKKQLLGHRWPGNVRELRNLTERIAYLSSGDVVDVDDLAFINAGGETESLPLNVDSTLNDATQHFQQKYIRQMIKSTQGNMSQAAHRLGLHRSNLYRKMRQLEIDGAEEGGGGVK